MFCSVFIINNSRIQKLLLKLDGSSIIETNFTIGSIFAIWPKGDLKKMTGRDMVGAALSLYGSRTNCILYNAINDCIDEVTL